MFGWDDSYAIGIGHIDAQHKELFNIIRELSEAMRERRAKEVVGKTLDRLLDYTRKHFLAEESMLRAKGYVELPQHKAIHDQFTAKIKKLADDHAAGALTVNLELMTMLQRWLKDHIAGTDRKYVAHVA